MKQKLKKKNVYIYTLPEQREEIFGGQLNPSSIETLLRHISSHFIDLKAFLRVWVCVCVFLCKKINKKGTTKEWKYNCIQ